MRITRCALNGSIETILKERIPGEHMKAASRTKVQHVQPLDFMHGVRLAEKYEIPISPTLAAHTEKELMAIEKRIPFPWAMKAAGKNINHKTDVGGVVLNIAHSHDAMMAFHHLKKISGTEYAVVQPMRKGIELIIGGKRDPQFGPTVLVGMGGIYTEVFKDSSLRIAPITDEDISKMISELKISPILHGARGQKGIDFGKLHQILRGVSKLLMNENVKELDLNPVIATPDTVEAVDVRIIE